MLGLYEKALPKTTSWPDKLSAAGELGFDFLEISVDESDERLSRLDWSRAERQEIRRLIETTEIPVLSMCFSGHRKYPLGSRDAAVRRKSLELMEKAIVLAVDLGVRVIQLAGYDVYYEEGAEDTKAHFIHGLRASVAMAAKRQVMLGVEIMDTPFLNSIAKYMEYDRLINSPWLAVYPDIGNISAWGNDVEADIRCGFSRIVGVHVKETKKVTADFGGQFRDMQFGSGDVDFAAAFRSLRQLNYAGPFVIEMWGDNLSEPLLEIERARDFVRHQLQEGGF